jgi:hypothetical protein
VAARRKDFADELIDQIDAFYAPKTTSVYQQEIKGLIPFLDKLLGRVGHFNVWLVRGRLVRDQFNIDFTMGGNPFRYAFIPREEIWIDAVLGVRDVAATIVHELVESDAMRHGLSYNKAHEIANVDERVARGKLSLAKPKVATRAAALSWARRFLTDRGIVRG